MTYEGKIINKKTIENLRSLLTKEIQEDYRKAKTKEEKEIIQALEILSYHLINSEEEEQKAKEDTSYEPKREKTIGGISFGGTTKEILENATIFRDILKNNSLIKKSSSLKEKELYQEEDTFELTLKDGTVLVFKKPIIKEDVMDSDLSKTEEYLQNFYEKYNKENLKTYYKSHKYKGEYPRIKYPHELFVFEPGKKPRLRDTLEENPYYEKVCKAAKKKKEDKKQKKAKSIFRMKRNELLRKTEDKKASEGIVSAKDGNTIDSDFQEQKKEKKRMVASAAESIKEGASSLKSTIQKRYKVINKQPASNFFKKALYGMRAGAGALTHKETWSSLWKIIKPFAIAGAVAGILGLTPVGSLLVKALLSCIKIVPLAIGNASKLIPYYLGTTTMSSAMLSACILNLAALIASLGVTAGIIVLIIKQFKNKGKNIEALDKEAIVQEKEEKEPYEKEEHRAEETIPEKGYLRRIRELKKQIKELETAKANIDDPTTKLQNEEIYYKMIKEKLEEEHKKGNLNNLEEEMAKLKLAKTDGSLIERYNKEIKEQIDKNIATIEENIDLLIEQFEISHFGENSLENKGMGMGSI